MRAFERKHGIELPPDYREFITEIGDGGPGPHYGLDSLRVASEYTTPSQPFPWVEAKSPEDEDFDDAWRDEPGVLTIAQRGCGYTDFMVVNGEAPYRIWRDGVAADLPLEPIFETFSEWYLAWARECLETLRRDELLERVRIGMALDELIAIFGEERRTWGERKVLGGRRVYRLAFDRSSGAFQMDEQHRVAKISRNETINVSF